MKLVLFTFVFVIISAIFSTNVSSQPYLIENANWQSNLEPIQWGRIAIGDLNKDNLSDMILIGCNGGSGSECASRISKVYINNGTSFVENHTWGSNLTNLTRGSISLGDIDNDVDLDLILMGCVSGGGGGSSECASRISKVYINNGTSFVENHTWGSNLTQLDWGSSKLGDINNDGYLDLILMGQGVNRQPYTKVYINNGTSFVENQMWQQNLHAVTMSSLSLADYDNDGDLDIILMGLTDSFRLYTNNGSCFIKNQTDILDGQDHFVAIYDGSVAFGDYNNDGFLDLIGTGHEKYTTLYIYNKTRGNYTDYFEDPEQQIIDLEFGPFVVWTDINNDMRLDIVIIGWGGGGGGWFQAKVYTNNITTSNQAPSAPAIGYNSTFNFSTGKLTLLWGNGSDTETPTLGLYYNLRVGTCSGCHDIVSGVFGGGDDNGYFGNMMQRKRIVLNRPDIENKTIYWTVQTIDTGLAKSAWSTEQIYHITQQCTENWTYSAWSSCINNQQTRTANDSNNCGTTINKSATTQSCTSYTPPSGGGTYTPPAAKKNETNGNATTGSSGTNTANTSGNTSSGANIGSLINGGNQSVSVCVPFDVKCEGNNLMECVSSGEWIVKQICEFGCADEECKKGNDFYGNLQYLLPVLIAVLIVGAGVFIGFRQFFGGKTLVSP
ncbi:MAG: FG-GAP-like repeat-containing protein [Candidatus Aenigmatarchaeota archaeon]